MGSPAGETIAAKLGLAPAQDVKSRRQKLASTTAQPACRIVPPMAQNQARIEADLLERYLTSSSAGRGYAYVR